MNPIQRQAETVRLRLSFSFLSKKAPSLKSDIICLLDSLRLLTQLNAV